MKNSTQPITPILDLNLDLTGLWGLTKREYFAGLAMGGLLSNTSLVNMAVYPTPSMEDSDIVTYSLKMADELLKQLEQ